MIDPISLYLAVYHTNMDGEERLVAGHVMGWKLQKRGEEFCVAYQNYGRIEHVTEDDYETALRLGSSAAERFELPFVNELDNVAYQKGAEDGTEKV